MFYTIDRFEEDNAVLLDDSKKVYSLPKELFDGFSAGSVFSKSGDDFIFEKDETEKRKNNAVSLHRRLFNKK